LANAIGSWRSIISCSPISKKIRASAIAFRPAGGQQGPGASADPLGRSADVCGAAIANSGAVPGDRIHAADGLSVYPDRRIRSLSKTPFLFGNFAARLSGSASALHRTASQLPSIPVFRNIIPCLYAGGT
jgi:hypothetical protein